MPRFANPVVVHFHQFDAILRRLLVSSIGSCLDKCLLSLQKGSNFSAQDRQNLDFEPRVLFQPDVVARAGMRQRKHGRPILLPVLHGLRQRCFLRGLEMPIERILADHQGEFERRQKPEELGAPFDGAFRAWWQVARRAGARITKAHRQNGDLRGVVELRGIDAHPGAKTLAARIVEGDAGFMNPATWRLPGDQYSRFGVNLEYWPRSKRQISRT